MTKGEQARLTAWWLKVLQQAAHERNVARVCRRFGISRKSFYKWKLRHAKYGDAGLCDRPRSTASYLSGAHQLPNGGRFRSIEEERLLLVRELRNQLQSACDISRIDGTRGVTMRLNGFRTPPLESGCRTNRQCDQGV